MDINLTKMGNVAVFQIRGRIDANTSVFLEQELQKTFDSGERSLVLDFAGLDYISSAGLRILLMISKKMKAVEGRIALSSLKEHIGQIFDIAGFSSITEIYPSLDEALASFN